MTLYWWMHWFWVTAHIAVTGCTVIGVSSPTTEISLENVTITTMKTITTSKQSFLIAKELIYPGATIASPLSKHVVPPTVAGISNRTMNSVYENATQIPPENKTTEKSGLISKSYASKKDILLKNTSKTIKVKPEESTKSINVTRENSLAVLPLNTDNLKENDKLNNISNSKIFSGLANNANNQISKKYTEKLVIESVSQSSTEAESSRSNRARGALFTIDLQRDQQTHQDKHFSKLSNTKDSKSMDMYSNSGTSPTDIAIITLSCLATIVLLSTAGSLGFIIYRRKYLNPPQTLNSDKCSNPDSSGYIDDSTIRDNSEEMYSLDNDSFLNSLEAMTIQNYWTDTVKHTKL